MTIELQYSRMLQQKFLKALHETDKGLKNNQEDEDSCVSSYHEGQQATEVADTIYAAVDGALERPHGDHGAATTPPSRQS